MDNIPYIEWGDVTITEETYEVVTIDNRVTFSSSWTAEFEGNIHTPLSDFTTQPTICFSRSGKTAADAADRLMIAAKDQGWEIR